MNKKIVALTLLALLAPLSISAQLHSYGPDLNYKDFIRNIEIVTGSIFGAVAVISFVIAGILFLTAQGDPAKLKTAKGAVLWGIIGVLVGIVAYSIIAIVGGVIR